MVARWLAGPRDLFIDEDRAAELALLGTSLAVLLTTALDNDGDLSQLATGRLADLDGQPA